MSTFHRLLSWLWPLRVAVLPGRSGDLELRWENGRLVVNSAQGNQSFGSLHRVWQRVLERVLVPGQPPANVLLLGLGGGSAPTILRKERGLRMPITAVEWDPAMVALARQHFGLDALGDITVVEGDATIQVHALTGRFELVLVDLFDDLDLARGVETMGFLHGLRDRCADGGVVCFNTVAYDEASDARCQRVHDGMQRVFHTVEEVRLEEMNRVFVAR
jgi:spermidine synthase